MRPIILIASLVISCAALVVQLDRAEACSCGRPRIAISPSSADAPINATVMAWVPNHDGPVKDLTLSLREKSSGDPVAVNYKSYGAADVDVVELVPKATLKPGFTYEVLASRKQGTPDVVGEFTTGKDKLTKAPVWNGVRKSTYHKGKAVCCNCTTNDPYAVLELRDGTGAPTAADEDAKRRLAIWMAGADGKLDYTKPPTTYQPGAVDQVWLGHPSSCSPADFTFPKSKALRLGVKLVDLAGNMSTASEIVFDTTKPAPPRR